MRKSLAFLSVVAFVFLLASCKHKYEPGFTGESVISGRVLHHDEPIGNAVVFMAFNAIEWPGTTMAAYDTMIVANADGFYRFENLNAGFYYLYSTGFDTQINQGVKGGVPVELSKKNIEKSIDVPVAE